MIRQDQRSDDLTRLAQNRVESKKKTSGYRGSFAVPLRVIGMQQNVPPSSLNWQRFRCHNESMWMNPGWTNAMIMATVGANAACALRRSNLDEERFLVNMIAAYCQRQLMAPFTVEGSCNGLVFETWLETCLVPVLEPGQVVILDNATFHHGGRIATLIESAGARLLYLPPYSPDLNRIEQCWAWLKSRIRKGLSSAASLRQAIESVLKEAQ